jgi:uncharacterized protein
MIKPGEIQNIARKTKVRDQQIEKDYILSWILQGIAQHKNLAKTIVFKGGTVLKKVYFEDYRFSEDLDFTLLYDEISNEQIFVWFNEVFEWVKEEANIPLEIIDSDSEKDRHNHKNALLPDRQGSINFHISYIGPLGGQGNYKKVKIDISRNEKVVFEINIQDVIISYSDQVPYQLLCYTLAEVLVEKMRTLMQRIQPRDFFDLWYLLEIHGMDIDYYMNEFNTKCKNKNINPTDFYGKLNQRLPQYKGRWQNSLTDQIHDLPDYEKVEREVLRHFKKLKTKP